MLYSFMNPHNVLEHIVKLAGKPTFSMEEESDRCWRVYEIRDDQGSLWAKLKILQSRDSDSDITHSEILFADFRPRKLDHIVLPRWDVIMTAKPADVGALVTREDSGYRFFGILPWPSPPSEIYPTEIFLRGDTVYEIVTSEAWNLYQPKRR